MSFNFDIGVNKYMFIHIPKSGGKSIVNTLDQFNPYKKKIIKRKNQKFIGHFTKIETEKIIKKDIEQEIKMQSQQKEKKEIIENPNYKFFCVLRNPWDRFISIYHYIAQYNPGEHGIKDLHEKIKNGMKFPEFVDHAIKDKRRIFLPQIDYIINEIGEVSVDDILMLDNINNDLFNFLKKNGIEEEITMKKINISKHQDYKTYYESEETINKIAKFEQGIINKFNFKFNNE